MTQSQLYDVVLTALNVVQTIALAWLAARYRPSQSERGEADL